VEATTFSSFARGGGRVHHRSRCGRHSRQAAPGGACGVSGCERDRLRRVCFGQVRGAEWSPEDARSNPASVRGGRGVARCAVRAAGLPAQVQQGRVPAGVLGHRGRELSWIRLAADEEGLCLPRGPLETYGWHLIWNRSVIWHDRFTRSARKSPRHYHPRGTWRMLDQACSWCELRSTRFAAEHSSGGDTPQRPVSFQ